VQEKMQQRECGDGLCSETFQVEDGILMAYTGAETEIQIPEGIHTIGEGAFKGMAWILKVKLPATLKRIGAAAFKGCRQLHEIRFPEGLSEIGEYAFHRCHKIEEMIFPKSMTQVGDCAFLYCDGLKRVVMEGPDHLGKGVFSHNLSLEEIALNRNVDSANFGDEVFEGCVRIRRISLSGELYEIPNLIEAMNSHASYPAIIKSIAGSVFHSMQIEDGVLKTFSVNLKSIFLPEGIIAIGKSCFYDKKGIVSITLPKSLREIRANAFLNCISLEEITIQNEELILDEKAFRGCSNLKKVHLRGEIHPLEEEATDDLVGRIRDQVLGDFYISGRILIRYLGEEEQIRIPKEVEIIGERCFFGKERLKTVLCPEGLREIREQAFAGCVTLQNIVLPDGLKRVEREAFAECKKLLKCNLPDNLEFIGEYAFRRCFLLTPFDPWPKKAWIHPYAFYRARNFPQNMIGTGATMSQDPSFGEFASGASCIQCIAPYAHAEAGGDRTAPHAEEGEDCIAPYAHAREEGIKSLRLTAVKRIGKYAFTACPDLEEIEIDAPECILEQNVFSACPSLKRVRLRVKEMGKATFSYCRKLKEVHFAGISVLPPECFAGCYSLQVFDAREITRMGARCFDECVQLPYIDFSNIELIGERAFERCDSLKKVVLHRVECGYHAFADCASLESLELDSDTVLRSGAFIGCTQIRSIVLHQMEKAGGEEDRERYEFSKFRDSLNYVGNPYPLPVREAIASIYTCYDIREGKSLMGYTQDATEITIPRDVEEVGQDAFRDHVRLAKIHIPDSVKRFGSHAFSQTAWLERQREQSDMVIVNQILLDGTLCRGRVELPAGIKRVASWCFAGNTDITELVIPSERIAIESLSFRNCLNLKRITDWNGEEYVLKHVSDPAEGNYPELIQRIFAECINCFKLDGEQNLVESTGNIKKLVFPEGIRSVGDRVYQDCHLLESIVLSSDTERIGRSAFENSKWLKSVSNAKAVSYVGALAFSGCQSLESIDLSDRLREMGSRCFEHCGSLKEITLSDQLERIPQRAFFRCKSLREIRIPRSVKVIEEEAFAFCEGLEEVYLPEETQVMEKAFAYCEHARIHTYK